MIREILLSVTLILLASQVQAQHEEVAEVDEMRVVFETTVCPEWKGFVKKQSFKVTPTFVTISTLAGVRNLEQGVPAEQVEKFEVVSIESEYFGVGFEVKYRPLEPTRSFAVSPTTSPTSSAAIPAAGTAARKPPASRLGVRKPAAASFNFDTSPVTMPSN